MRVEGVAFTEEEEETERAEAVIAMEDFLIVREMKTPTPIAAIAKNECII